MFNTSLVSVSYDKRRAEWLNRENQGESRKNRRQKELFYCKTTLITKKINDNSFPSSQDKVNCAACMFKSSTRAGVTD